MNDITGDLGSIGWGAGGSPASFNNSVVNSGVSFNNPVVSSGAPITYQTIKSAVDSTINEQNTTTLDLFEEQFKYKYKIDFSDFINAFKADHPELLI